MNDSPSMLVHAKGLRKDYGSGEGLVRALDAIDLDVSRGEAVAVMGPSGCGKSTLLHLIGGLDRPSAGALSVAGQRIGELSERALAHFRREEIGFVFQAFHLMDELTAQENVELPALLAGYSPNEARTRATSLLEEVDLADRARRLSLDPVHQADQRRVFLGRRALMFPFLRAGEFLCLQVFFEHQHRAGHVADFVLPGSAWYAGLKFAVGETPHRGLQPAE